MDEHARMWTICQWERLRAIYRQIGGACKHCALVSRRIFCGRGVGNLPARVVLSSSLLLGGGRGIAILSRSCVGCGRLQEVLTVDSGERNNTNAPADRENLHKSATRYRRLLCLHLHG